MTAKENRAEPVSIRFTMRALEWLRSYADDNDISISAVVNMAVRSFINQQEANKKILEQIQDPEVLARSIGAYQKAGGDMSLFGEQISIDDLINEKEEG